MPKNAVVLLHRGDPRTPEEVETFLRALYSDPNATSLPFGQAVQVVLGRWIARMDSKALTARLQATGGRSTWHQRIEEVAAELEKLFNGANQGTAAADWLVRAAYSHRPEGFGALQEVLKAEGVTRVVGVSLYPHKATRRGGAVVQAFLRSFGEGSGITVSVIERLASDPGYLELLRKQLEQAPVGVTAEGAPRPTVVFAAPGIEKADFDTGDEYRASVEQTAAQAVEKLPFDHKVAWIGEKMPGPLLPAVLGELAAAKARAVLLVPLGTSVDEVNVVHALDVEARELARQQGIPRLDRAPMLASEPGFAPLLHKVVNDHLTRVSALGLA